MILSRGSLMWVRAGEHEQLGYGDPAEVGGVRSSRLMSSRLLRSLKQGCILARSSEFFVPAPGLCQDNHERRPSPHLR